MVAQVYESASTGGWLHIVLDDWNVDDRCLDYCERDLAKAEAKPYDPDGDEAWPWSHPDSLKVQRECLVAFRGLSEDERYSALAMEEGLWLPGVPQPSEN